ncbi:hypothetical protein J2Z31_000479 [Sinorhizobium kostiense]|uniref:VanZ-like domain-containing protein n=1 Tax=Sinorhizobium kostiense TaxID=76747 RepID=A0ABS4QU36_9HYPH|nr:hypothetical protein [Sinorhizobium kostiense]MBP2233989.1 hypothetical protein [Sinorhizobium kostiense]
MQTTKEGRRIAWVFVALALIANIAGYSLGFYRQWWWFDRVLHGFTIFALTLWLGIFYFLVALQPYHGRSLRVFLIMLSVGVAAGAIWEVFEWGVDMLASTNVIKGKNDTIWDIIMDTAGAGLAALLIRPFLSDRQDR